MVNLPLCAGVRGMTSVTEFAAAAFCHSHNYKEAHTVGLSSKGGGGSGKNGHVRFLGFYLCSPSAVARLARLAAKFRVEYEKLCQLICANSLRSTFASRSAAIRKIVSQYFGGILESPNNFHG